MVAPLRCALLVVLALGGSACEPPVLADLGRARFAVAYEEHPDQAPPTSLTVAVIGDEFVHSEESWTLDELRDADERAKRECPDLTSALDIRVDGVSLPGVRKAEPSVHEPVSGWSGSCGALFQQRLEPAVNPADRSRIVVGDRGGERAFELAGLRSTLTPELLAAESSDSQSIRAVLRFRVVTSLLLSYVSAEVKVSEAPTGGATPSSVTLLPAIAEDGRFEVRVPSDTVGSGAIDSEVRLTATFRCEGLDEPCIGTHRVSVRYTIEL